MRVDVVAGTGWEAALADRERLYECDPTVTPFTSPGWALAWMRVWGQGMEPWLLRVSDGAHATPVGTRLRLPQSPNRRLLGSFQAVSRPFRAQPTLTQGRCTGKR